MNMLLEFLYRILFVALEPSLPSLMDHIEQMTASLASKLALADSTSFREDYFFWGFVCSMPLCHGHFVLSAFTSHKGKTMVIVGRVWLCMQGNDYFMVRFLSANARILDDGPRYYDKCVVEWFYFLQCMVVHYSISTRLVGVNKRLGSNS